MLNTLKTLLKFGLLAMTSLLAYVSPAQSQTYLSLDTCLILANQNYPQVRQYRLLEQSSDFSIANAQKGKLPQIHVVGQASYQSEVTSLPSGGSSISKDQYKLYADITQPLTDIGVINQRKRILENQNELDKASLNIQMYQLNSRMSDLYFGALLLQNQLVQTDLTRSNLNAGIQAVEAAVKYGVALESNLEVLQAERLTLLQRQIEQEASLDGFQKMLSLFIGVELNEAIQLQKQLEVPLLASEINRPELSLFTGQLNGIALQNELLTKSNRPKLNLFLQTGFGRPALNFLSNDFDPYYIGGVRFSWKISSYFTSANQRQLFAVNEQWIESEKETFLFNTNLALERQQTEVLKMQRLIIQDKEIITLREKIVRTSKNQLANGVITANDYQKAVVAEDLARQNNVLHEIELLKIINDYKIIAG
ncbi:MAG: outer membrane protein TolC, partial [Paraglaciecola sp.]